MKKAKASVKALLQHEKLDWGDPQRYEYSEDTKSFTFYFATPEDETDRFGVRRVFVDLDGEATVAPRR